MEDREEGEEEGEEEEEEIEAARSEGSPQNRLNSSLLESDSSSPMVDRSPEGMESEGSPEGMNLERTSPTRTSLPQTSSTQAVLLPEEARILTNVEQLRLLHQEVLDTERLSDDARDRYRTGRSQGSPFSTAASQAHQNETQQYTSAVRAIENKIRMHRSQLSLSQDPAALEEFIRFLIEQEARWYNTRLARSQERLNRLDNYTLELEQRLEHQMRQSSQQNESNQRLRTILETHRDEATRARNVLADRVSEASQAIHAINDELVEPTTPLDPEVMRTRQHGIRQRLTEIVTTLDEHVAPSGGSIATSQQPDNDCPKKLARANREIKELQKKIEQIEKDNDRALEIADELKVKVREEKARADGLSMAIKNYASDRESWVVKENKLQSEKNKAQKEVKNLQEKLEQANSTPMDVDQANEYNELKEWKEEHLKKNCELALARLQQSVSHYRGSSMPRRKNLRNVRRS